MRCIAVAWLFLGACARPPAFRAAPSPPETAPPVVPVEDTAGLLTFAPSGEPAARYNDALPPIPQTPFHDAVAAVVREEAAHAGLGIPQPDGRLFGACTDLAELVLQPGREQAPFDRAAIEFALQRNGIIEPEVGLVFGAGDVTSPASFVAELRSKLAGLLRDGPITRFGIGVAPRRPDGTAAIVFALQGSAISTTPIPRSVPARGEIAIDGMIGARFHDVKVIVTHEDGSTGQRAVEARPGGFAVRFACDGRSGRQQVEIAASDSTGATVLANFPVWCGSEPPRSIAFEPAGDDPPAERPEQAEQYLLASINGDRAAAQLPLLVWSAEAAAVARAHSEEMRTTRVVSHISPTTGAAVDRVHAANIPTRIVLENVARCFGLHEAHRALMNSPGHRANLMSAEVTHVGIGVVLGAEVSGRREIYITEVFLRMPLRTDPCASAAIRGCGARPMAPL